MKREKLLGAIIILSYQIFVNCGRKSSSESAIFSEGKEIHGDSVSP